MNARCPARLRAALFLSTVIGVAAAAPFTPGNVVVYRAGNGSGGLVATGNPVFLDEYSPAGTLVQSIALPTVGSGAQKALVASGSATSDGLLTRSADGSCLAVPGYGRDLGASGGNLTSGTVGVGGPPIPRVVARVRATGAIDTSTALTDAATGSNFRGAASADCNGFWVSGTGGGGGVRFATLGATTSSDVTGATFANTRAVAVYGGQLYMSASVTNLRGVATLGTGLPTTALAAAEIRKLTGMTDTNSPGTYAFFLADLNPAVPGVDTLYVADELGGALSKFSLVGSTWVLNGTLGTSTDAYRGITGVVNGASVTLYATRRTGSTTTPGGELVTLTDASGHNGAFAGTPAVLATAGANMVFRGVALAPAITVVPSAGANGVIEPATPQTAAGGSTRTFIVTANAGYTAVVGGTCGGSLSGNTFTTDALTANCTVSATFTQIPTFVVTPIAGANGSITPATPRTLLSGAVATFTIAPAPGYAASVGGTCAGTLSGNTFTTDPVTADCTVTATFTLITFTVTPSAAANGTINPSVAQTLPQGSAASFTVAPAFGFGAVVGGSCGGALVGNTYTTQPVVSDCSVNATFVPLPRYSVTPSAGPNGTISPATVQTVISGQVAAFTITPAPGYSTAIRGSCGGTLAGNTFTTNPALADCSVAVTFARRLVLFVGNSYTFGRVDPVMSYNAANVSDLTHAMWVANPAGSNDDEPHPWGGIPGVFKKLTDQAGLDYDVSISARNAASLRGHYLNSNPAGWDLRGNIASQRWDTVVLQDLSDEPLPPGRGANANLAYFNAYVDKIEAWVHAGAAESYTETQLFGGSIQACRDATGASASACETPRIVSPANANASPQAEVILYETWARPDMIAPNGTNASGTFYTEAEGLEAMTADFHAAYFGRATANAAIDDVAPVGDAFLRAVQMGVAMRDPYVPEAGKIDLWHTDFFHPSKYGSYLSALVHFATLTGLNPLMLGAGEQAAADLGIAPAIAVQLQRVAQATVAPDTTPPVTSASVSEPANAMGWNNANVTVTFAATDEARGSGLDFIAYSTSGAQSASGTSGNGGTLAISAEGVTTLTYYAIDRAGNAEAPHTLRIAIDRTAPVFAGLPGPECSLWPPNHKMVAVASLTASSGAAPIASFNVAVASSEPAAPGESDVAISTVGSARVVALRAERDAKGSGRIYSFTVSAIDAAGNASAASATCRVPLAQGK